jgi:hypothetical protein
LPETYHSKLDLCHAAQGLALRKLELACRHFTPACRISEDPPLLPHRPTGGVETFLETSSLETIASASTLTVSRSVAANPVSLRTSLRTSSLRTHVVDFSLTRCDFDLTKFDLGHDRHRTAVRVCRLDEVSAEDGPHP